MPDEVHAEPMEALVARTAGLQPWRRLVHLVTGSGIAWTVYVLSPGAPTTRWLFGTALAITFLTDMARLRFGALNRLCFRAFGALLRPREADGLSLTWFLTGVFAVLWFPGERAAVAALLVLAVADPAAAVVGRLWGRHRVGKGTWEGTLAFFATAAVTLTPFVGVWAAGPVSAVVAGAEAFSTKLDDNFVIPVVTAACVWAVTGAA